MLIDGRDLAIFTAGGTLVNFAVSAFSGRLAAALTRRPRFSRWFARLPAALFVALAAHIAFAQR